MNQNQVIRANRARMKKEFDAQSRIGRHGKTGLARVALTPDYNRVRELVRRWMESAGLKTRVDAVGNDFLLFPIPNCGKGQPMQAKRMGNGGPTMRSVARLVGGG